jgi:hypothetical protein
MTISESFPCVMTSGMHTSRRQWLRRKQLSQYCQNVLSCRFVDSSETTDQVDFIHRADLVQDNLTSLSLESDRNSCWIRPFPRSHGSNDNCTKIAVQFVG